MALYWIRQTAPALFCFGLLATAPGPAAAQILDITWELGPNYPSSIKAGAVGVVNDTLVYAGGTPVPALNGSNDSNRTYGIPIAGGSWTALPNMPKSITYFDGQTVNDSLYVTGGRSNFASQGTTYRLTEDNGTWQWDALPALNVARGYFAMGQTGGLLMIEGGIQGNGQPPYDINTTINAPELFDTNNPQAGWQSIAGFPGVTRMEPAVAGVGGKFYVFGGTIFGYQGSDSLRLSDAYVYDPVADQWSSLPNTPYGMSGAEAVVYQDRYIIMLGGVAQISENDRPNFHPEQPGYYDTMVKVFDTVTQTYSIMPSDMPYGTSDQKAAIVGNKIYSVGGESKISADSFTEPWYQIGQIQLAPDPGNTLFNDGFEAGTIGAHPAPAMIGAWSSSQLGNSMVQVAGAGGPGPGAAAVGDKYLSLFRASEPPLSDISVKATFVSQPTTETIHAEWRAWIPNDIGDYGMFVGLSDDSAFGTFSKIGLFSTVAGLPRVFYRKTTEAWDLADLTYLYETWQKWEVDWKLGSGELTLTIDGVSQVLTIPDAVGIPLDHLLIRSGNFNQQFAIDEVFVVVAVSNGDVNFDGVVDIFDVNFVSSNWGGPGPRGDANQDGVVDIFDVNLISANWSAGGAAAVPEPTGFVLAVVSLIGTGCVCAPLRRKAKFAQAKVTR